jgi:hypothetical protein
VAIADFDQDGHLDLAVTSYVESNVGVYLGKGDGTFQERLRYGTGLGCQGVTTGDFDGDGRPDLAVANRLVGTVGFLRNLGGGAFSPAVDTAMSTDAIQAADFDGDGKDELVTGYYGSPTRIVALGTSGPTAVEVPVSFVWQGWAPADFDGDGVLDLAAHGDDGLVIAYSAGDASRRVLRTIAMSQTAIGPIVAADFNQDGAPDLAVSVRIQTAKSATAVAVFLNDGSGNLGFRGSTIASAGFSLSVADLNGDGIPDLVASDGTHLELLTGTGDGGFNSNRFLPFGGWSASIAVGDLDGDGKDDVVVTNPSSDVLTVFLTSFEP